MDMGRVTTSFQTSQSMGTKEICILVVHDDPIYRNIMAEMLQYCSHYEVLKFERINDALNAIREKKGRLNLILTDIHRSNKNGFEILHFIEKEFKLPILSMSPIETAELVSIGLGSGVKLYFLKSSVNEFKTLWQYAYTKVRGKAVSAEVATSAQKALVHENVVDQASIENTSLFCEVNRSYQKRKRRESKETDQQNEGDDSPNEKKRRVVWTDLMHQKFLEAIEQLGHERAFPKRIVEVMDVPGLTRESVASHLQKYRMCMKMAQEGMLQSSTDSIYEMNLTPHVKETCFPSIHSALNCNSAPQGNPLYSGNISMPYTSNQSCLFNPEASNLEHEKLFRVRNQENLEYPYGLNESSLDAVVENSISQIGFESTSSVYVGYRLAGNGKSVESGQMGVSGNDESLVQCPSTSSMDGVSEQQPSLLPPFLSVPHDLDSLGDGGVMDVQLNPLGSRSPEMFWDGDFDNTLFNHTD